MSAKNATTHTLIERQLVVYRRERSAVWQCRYSVDGRWQRTSTHERELKLARRRAHDILVEANVRKKMNAAPITRFFRDVARSAVARMQKELAAGNGKVIFKDYISTIQKYLIPFFGKHKIDSVDYQLLEQFSAWRDKRMEKKPRRSTLLNHNAALNRVFDEAVIRGFMVESNRPKLVAKGKKSERRPDFSLEEVRALRTNFDAWIAQARADSVAVRALLRDYVLTLLDTGARPGRELLKLTWPQIELKMYPVITPTDHVDEEGEPVDLVNANRTVFLRIQEGKTGQRIAIGRQPTAAALRNIAERNYGKTIQQMLDAGCNEEIFRFREYVSNRQESPAQTPRLLPPTSFSKLFDQYLSEHNLLIDPVTKKRRVLYSLRHTYATLALTYDRINPLTLAKQMGTSIAMIEQHYSHLDAVKAVHQLRGEESRSLIEAAEAADEKYKFKEPKSAVSRKR